MRREHRPKSIKQLSDRFSDAYAKHFLHPQFAAIGPHLKTVKPWLIGVYGDDIRIGRSALLAAMPDRRLSLTTVQNKQHQGSITIGDYCLLSPGVRIESNCGITIGNNCMLAANAYIGDSDWHGVYNRVSAFRCNKPVSLGNNVWVGMNAIVLKGVTIGDNSVVGAAAVVTKDVPANVVVAGNPATIVKRLNPNRRRLTREFILQDPAKVAELDAGLLEYITAGNSYRDWLRSLLWPRQTD